jgi:hypothetical protein
MTEQTQPRSLADRCRSTCRRGPCTGHGDLSRWAHRCPFAPPPPPPTCTLYLDGSMCGAQAVGRFLPGWRCSEHAPRLPDTTPLPASPARAPREYGTATTDPLGRTGPLNQYRLPTRAGE